MNTKEVKTEKNEEIPKICTYRGLKPEIFKRAHKKAKELELSGKMLLLSDWRKILSDCWDEVKEEVEKVCHCTQPEEKQQELPEEKLEHKTEQRIKQMEQTDDSAPEQTSAEEKLEEA